MESRQFTINRERYALRCDICHQADRFDSVSGHCTRCHTISSAAAASSIDHEFKPLLSEMLEQVTPAQTLLLALTGGIITGIVVDINANTAGLNGLIAMSVSAFSALALMAPSARQFHPITSGFLFTLTIAPWGWLLLAAIYWLTQKN